MDSDDYKIKTYKCDREELINNWEVAAGLQAVDNLRPSDYLYSQVEKHIEGKLNYDDIRTNLNSYYSQNENIPMEQREADLVTTRIAEMLQNAEFTFSTRMLNVIHGFLFKDVLDARITGKFRNYGITKKEPILNGNSVVYGTPDEIKFFLDDVLAKYKNIRLSFPLTQSDYEKLASFISELWRIHPFGEGNTRTVAVFFQLYMNTIGIQLNNDDFKKNSCYFRNALVRCNYSNVPKQVYEDNQYLVKFIANLFKNEPVSLSNYELFAPELFPDADELEEKRNNYCIENDYYTDVLLFDTEITEETEHNNHDEI